MVLRLFGSLGGRGAFDVVVRRGLLVAVCAGLGAAWATG